jgi:hypothetical protein
MGPIRTSNSVPLRNVLMILSLVSVSNDSLVSIRHSIRMRRPNFHVIAPWKHRWANTYPNGFVLCGWLILNKNVKGYSQWSVGFWMECIRIRMIHVIIMVLVGICYSSQPTAVPVWQPTYVCPTRLGLLRSLESSNSSNVERERSGGEGSKRDRESIAKRCRSKFVQQEIDVIRITLSAPQQHHELDTLL